MDRFVNTNPNPKRKTVGDCVIRAIAIALDIAWDEAYIDICAQGFKMADMPSANYVWGEFLRSKGFSRATAPPNMTVCGFCEANPYGVYVLGCDSHVVAAADGNYFDTWDSGDEAVLYYWTLTE